jgi:hypothetical protein
MEARSRRRLLKAAPAIAAVAVAALWIAAGASAADSVFWANFRLSPAIGRASLDGAGGSDLSIAGVPGQTHPTGTAIDAAAGRIYWSSSDEAIDYANLDGSGGGELRIVGTTVGTADGLAIDPVARRIYWDDQNTESIKYANLDGSGGTVLNTAGATVNRPFGIAVDPVHGRIYWTNIGQEVISYANLNGSGGADLNTQVQVQGALGVAIDATAGRVYWTNAAGGSIGVANLDGSASRNLDTPVGFVHDPGGIAIDAEAERLYFVNRPAGGSPSIVSVNLNGGSPVPVNTTGGTLTNPIALSLLKTPLGVGAPTITGETTLGSTLSCSGGSWASDQPGAFLYRVPQTFSYQWSRDGQPIVGATTATLQAGRGGSYACKAIAGNAAGSAAQASAAVAIPGAKFSLGKLKRNKKKGTATLSANVSTPGTLAVAGKLLLGKRVTAGHGGIVKITIKPNRAGRRKLESNGKLAVRATLTFAPAHASEKIVRKMSLLLRTSR